MGQCWDLEDWARDGGLLVGLDLAGPRRQPQDLVLPPMRLSARASTSSPQEHRQLQRALPLRSVPALARTAS